MKDKYYVYILRNMRASLFFFFLPESALRVVLQSSIGSSTTPHPLPGTDSPSSIPILQEGSDRVGPGFIITMSQYWYIVCVQIIIVRALAKAISSLFPLFSGCLEERIGEYTIQVPFLTSPGTTRYLTSSRF